MSDAASWVQAIGSVAAIWTAARLVIFQQRSVAVDRLEAINALAAIASEQIDTAASAVREAVATGFNGLAEFPVRRLRHAEAGLAGVPLHELPSPLMLSLIVDLHQLVADVRRSMETLAVEEHRPDLSLVTNLRLAVCEAAQISNDIRCMAEAARRRTRLSWVV